MCALAEHPAPSMIELALALFLCLQDFSILLYRRPEMFYFQ